MNAVDVVCVGLSVVNFPVFPVDESIFTRDINPVSPITLLPGGDAANQAIILSRLGLKTALATRRGHDNFGTVMVELLRDHGIDIDLSGVVEDDTKSTSVCAMMIKPDGQRHFCAHKGVLYDFCIDDIDLSVLSRAKVASIGGMYGLPSFDGKGSAVFFKAAREQGVITVADTKADIMGIGFEGIRETLANTDYFFPSYDEAAAISGESQPERMAQMFLDAGAKNVGIKLGSKGCYMRNAQTEFYIPVIPSEVVDTTGAGDNFMSGFIAGLLHGWSLRKCCLFGTASAALCVTQVGPTSAVKCFDQVKAVMDAAAE
ncbi:MAG: carbohydrate kinase family protein [Acetanaerobacterium sp.]